MSISLKKKKKGKLKNHPVTILHRNSSTCLNIG